MTIPSPPLTDIRAPVCHPRWRWHLLFAIVIGALIVVLAALSIQNERQRSEERVSSSTQNIVRMLDQQIRGSFAKIDLVLHSAADHYTELAATGALHDGTLNRYLAQQESLLPEIISLRVADRDGIVRLGNDLPTNDPISVRDRDYFSRARDNPEAGLILTGPVFARISKQWVLILARRLNRPDGGFAGVVYANLPCAYFETILAPAITGPNSAATLRMTDMSLVHRVPSTKDAVGSKNVSPQLRMAISSHPEGSAYTAITTLDGIERANAFRPVNGYPLYVIVGQATQDIQQSWQHSAWVIGSLSGLALCLTWLATFWVYRSQCRLNEDIVMRIEISQALEKSIDECTQLYTELQHRKDALEEANTTLETKVAERTTALRKANQELERLARRDALTQLGNRRAADEHLREEYLRMRRTGACYALLLIDIDHFKEVNDRHGHEQGDSVLRFIASCLGTSCRATDFVARFGGEEFLVILPDTLQENAVSVAEKIRQTIEGTSAPLEDHITVSIGLACANCADLDESDALRQADRNLYRAKAGGRNQVIA